MEIYLYLNDAQAGPFDEQQIGDMLQSGSIQATDFAWHDGLPDWQPLNEVVPLVPAAPGPPPLMPPVRQAALPQRSPSGVGVGIAIFLVVVALAGGVGTWLAIRIQHNRAGMQKLDEAQKDLVSDMRKNLKQPDAQIGSAQQEISHYSQELGSASADFQGSDKAAAEAGQRYLKLLEAPLQKYTAAYGAFRDAGFTKAQGIQTKEDLQHRRDLNKAFGDANAQLADFYKNSENTLRGELKKGNLGDAYIATVLQSFEKSANINSALQIRQLDADLAGQAGKIFDIYDREWGKWHLDENNELKFEDSAAVTDYNNAQAAIRDIAAKQQALQQQVLQSVEASGKPQ